jgi:hypothetical protein
VLASLAAPQTSTLQARLRVLASLAAPRTSALPASSLLHQKRLTRNFPLSRLLCRWILYCSRLPVGYLQHKNHFHSERLGHRGGTPYIRHPEGRVPHHNAPTIHLDRGAPTKRANFGEKASFSKHSSFFSVREAQARPLISWGRYLYNRTQQTPRTRSFFVRS